MLLPIRMQGLDPLEAAIVGTVAYGDIFDYPLTVAEIHRYLTGVPAALPTIQQALSKTRLTSGYLDRQGDYVFLAGREELVTVRRRRGQIAQALWPRACHYGSWIAHLPFVRMVAVTGALAVDNVELDADIDYLIVTEPKRLWLCRALVVGLVRWAARRGHVICPNYFLSENALVIHERNLYTARELTQMVPLAGFVVYRRMRQLNSWIGDLLPNAQDAPQGPKWEASRRWIGRGVAEDLLRTPFGGRLETWEMQRKMRKLQQQAKTSNPASPSEINFSADWCKGHFGSHGQRTLGEFAHRLDQLTAGEPPPPLAPSRQPDESLTRNGPTPREPTR